jgi:hypothetical protein
MRKSANKAAALDHVLYEIEMLTHSLLTLPRGDLSRPERNAWIEVFAIHSRNLNEFYSNKEFGKAYMRPSDFITWQHNYSFDAVLARRASAQVAHLTYDRPGPGQRPSWPLESLFKSLRDASLHFLREVSRVDSLMIFENNRQRCATLLNRLPRIHFQ